jgi:3-hydroxybutyryl-CoA dehydrogenase
MTENDSAAAVVGIVGAGAMGSGIAQVALTRGHRVLLTDSFPAALARGRDNIGKALRREVEKGRLQADHARDAEERLEQVDPSKGLGAFSQCSIVVEAIVESLEAKQATFTALEEVVARQTILATNTSSLSVGAIAARCAHPERVVGVHFFNPAPVLPLVEIVPGLRTSEEAKAYAHTLVTTWGKTPVLASDTPGFIVNRVARPFYGESLCILEEGMADAATIDWALRELGGFRMGPFLLMDFIGNDVNYAVTESVWRGLFYHPRYRPSVTQRRLVEAGWLGRKTGRGFYDYHPDAPPRQAVEDPSLGRKILDRVLAMLVNEATDAIWYGIATANDLETAMTMGVNYPRGLLAWGDELGPRRVLDEIDRLHGERGDRYQASPLLRSRVREGRSLRE